MTFKIIAIAIFAAILFSLASALFHLVKRSDAEQSRKTAKALTFRIGLSLVLFLLLFLALVSGWLQPGGIGARMQQSHSASPTSEQPAQQDKAE